MTSLPFLVVHGALVWKLIVLAVGALAIATSLVLRKRRETKTTRDLVEARDLPTELHAGIVTVRGTLSGDVTTLSEHPTYGDAPRSKRSQELFVTVGDQRVVLEGDAAVIRGTTATAAWLGFPPTTPTELTTDVQPHRRRLFSVKSGDDVIVQGTAEHGDAGWTIKPTVGTIEIIARKPAIVPPGLSPIRLAVVAFAAMLASYGAMRVIGSAKIEAAKEHTIDKRDHTELDSSAVFAAAMPHVRDQALDHLDYELDYGFPRTEANQRLRYDLAALEKGCRRARLMLDDGLYDEALAAAKRCGSQEIVGTTLLGLGRYEEASTALATVQPQDSEKYTLKGTAAIGAGHWLEAATLADEAAQMWTTSKSGTSADATEKHRAVRLHCLASWMRSKADPKQPADEKSGTLCRILATLSRPADERIKTLEEINAESNNDEYAEHSLAHDIARAEPSNKDADFELWDLGLFSYAQMWLYAPSTDGTIATHGALAVRAMLLGDLAGARTELAAARALPTDVRSSAQDLDALAATIELRTPSTTIPPLAGMREYQYQTLRAQLALRAGQKPTSDLRISSYHCEGVLPKQILSAAQTGDATELAASFSTCQLFSNNESVLIAIAPRITKGKELLAEQIRLYSEAGLYRRVPFEVASYMIAHRDMSRLIGDEPTAAHWQGILGAHAKVLADRDKVIAFMAWQLL